MKDFEALNKNRLLKLERLASDSSILLRYVKKGLMNHSKWQGLIYHSSELGTAIAIRDELTTDQKVLVLAHELGHYFTGVNDSLFNTLEYGGIYNRQDIENERKADAKGFKLLYDPIFLEAEKKYLLDIPSLCRAISLPVDIIKMWDSHRLLKKPNAMSNRFILNPFLMNDLKEKSNNGSGGFQTLLRRIVLSSNKNGVRISLKDFLSMRKAVINGKGGYVKIYKRVLDELKYHINLHGGVDIFFSMNET